MITHIPDEIPTDREVTLYRCPVCGQETIWFECGEYENGDPETPYYESGYGPLLSQACTCRITTRQLNDFPVPMDMCVSSDDLWGGQ